VRRRAKVKASGLDEVPRSFSPRKGCSGQAKSRKARVERRSAGPLGQGVQQSRWPEIELIEPTEGAWGSGSLER